MSTDTANQKAFVNHLDVAFDIWEDLLVDVFDSTEFSEWLNKEHSWQLRIVGPPGCGKTTVSALAEQRLRAWYSGQNVRIACIYFQIPVRSKNDDFLLTLLKDVLLQLSDGVENPGLPSDIVSLDSLREALRKRISQLDHTYLLVDDIDLCRTSLLQVLEAELAHLQMAKLSIMVTARVPHIYNTDAARCDTHEDNDMALVYWCCKRCELQHRDEEERRPKAICQACKVEGKMCPECGKNDSFFEPYDHILYQLRYLDNIPQFIARELEIAHGDLGLESDLEEKPPLSTLGRALERTKPLLAERLRDGIASRSDFNIALVKARLDSIYSARSMEDIEHVGDRLPDPMLAVFEAAIDRINHVSFQDRDLGLNALLAAAIRFQGYPFSELETWLQSVGLLGQNPAEDSDHNLLRTLHATCGLLVVDYGKNPGVTPYTDYLTIFIQENYSSVLYNLRRRVDEIKIQDDIVNADGAD